MRNSNALLRFPTRIEVPKSLGGGVYVLRSDCYALKGAAHPREPEGVLFELEGGATVVLRGQPTAGERRAVPVYEQPGGELGVPTGLLFARFRESTSASEQSHSLAAVGYEIVKVPGWAPHAAWIQATGGDLQESLDRIGALAGVGGLENVEPQMLGRIARRR